MQKFYTTIKSLLTSYYIKILHKKVFAKVVLNQNIKVFEIYIIFLNIKIKMITYLACKVYIIFQSIEKALKNILAKYLNFINMFLEKLFMKLS